MPSSSFPNNTSISADKFLPALHHAISGSAGTLISTCALYPLSLVITRLQVQRQLQREGKLSGDGNNSSKDEGTTTTSPSGRGAATGPAQEPTYAGITEAFSRIWSSNGGPRAFYTGLAHDAAKSVLDSFLFFLFYEWFRSVRLAASSNRRRRRGGGEKTPGLGVLEELAVGVAAGACSRFFTTPIANVVTRKQTASLVDATEGREVSAREIADAIRKEKGLAGFWSGYSASLVLTLNPSITFFLQEFLKKRAVAADSWDSPAPHVTFLLAAVSKAVASAVTYPFQTAKTRMQTGVSVVAPEPQSSPKEESQPPAEIEAGPTEEEKTDKASMEAQASEAPEGPTEEAKALEGETPAPVEASGETAAPVEGESPVDAAPAQETALSEVAPDEIVAAAKEPEAVTIHNVAPPERNVERDGDAKLDPLRALRDFGRRSVFGTVAQIARTEGVGSLYDGVQGELIKGFLSHGTTMLAKDVVHKLLFRLYMFLAGMLAEMRARRRARAAGAGKGGGKGGGLVSLPSLKLPLPKLAALKPSSVPKQVMSSPETAPVHVPMPLPSISSSPAPTPAPVAAALPPPPPSPSPLPRSVATPTPRQELRALRYRLDRWERPPPPPGSSRTVVHDHSRASSSVLDDFGVNVVANMIDGTQRGFKG
ncbi:mitochondrial carrier domain-containing protein [Hypoxylon crocopeplum]|nr:mitochondrial carrier domain-containing protein [Hypoxylon crocopeplum]